MATLHLLLLFSLVSLGLAAGPYTNLTTAVKSTTLTTRNDTSSLGSALSSTSSSKPTSVASSYEQTSTSSALSFDTTTAGIGSFVLQGLGFSLTSAFSSPLEGTSSVLEATTTNAEPTDVANVTALIASSSAIYSDSSTHLDIISNSTRSLVLSSLSSVFSERSTALTSLNATAPASQEQSNQTTTQTAFAGTNTGSPVPINSTIPVKISSTPYINSTTNTLHLNASIAPTGTGSVYASQCNALWNEWSASSRKTPNEVATKLTGTYTFTKWAASTTTLGGCDSSVRLVGSFTPTATAIGSDLNRWAVITNSDFAVATPACSVSPSDCEELYQASLSSVSAFQAAYTAAVTTVMLAPYAAALTVGTETTTFGTGSMATPPIITLNNTAYTATITTLTAYTATLASSIFTNPAKTMTMYDMPVYNQRLVDNSTIQISGYVDSSLMPQWQMACNRTVTETSCGACTIYGGEVQLMYFPVAANASRDMCAATAASPTMCPLGPTTAPYAIPTAGVGGSCNYVHCPYFVGNTSTADSGPYIVSAGTTFYENRAYISVQTAYASNSCGYIGGRHAGSMVTVASSQVFSMNRVHGDCADQGNSFNFADLEPNLPMSAFNTAVNQNACRKLPQFAGKYPDYDKGDWVNGRAIGYSEPCNTIIDWAYFPTLVVPTQIRDLDPAWATCAVALDGLYDPPKVLTAQTTVAGPASSAHTIAASPASSAVNVSPQPTSAQSTTRPNEITTPGLESTDSSNALGQTTTQPANIDTSTVIPASSQGRLSSQASASTPASTAGPAPAPPANSSPPSSEVSPAPASLDPAKIPPNPVISILTNALSSSNVAAAATTSQGSQGSQGSGSSGGPAGDPTPSQSNQVGSVRSSDQATASNPGGAIVSVIADGEPASSTSAFDPGSGSSPTGSDSRSSPANNVATVGSSTFVIAPADSSSAVVVSGGGSSITLVPGQSSSIGGQVVSAPSSGGAVIGTGSNAVTIAPASETAINPADPVSGSGVLSSVVSVGSSPFTVAATQIAGSSALVIAHGGTTATLVLGASTTFGGQAVSAPSSGGVVIGTGRSASTMNPDPDSQSSDPTTSGAVLVFGSSITVSAIQTVVTGEDGQATPVAIVGDSTIAQGSIATVSGHVISVGPNGIIVDGTQTQQMTALPSSQPASSGAIVQIGSSTLTALETMLTGSNGKLTTEVILGGSTTITAGGSAATVDGHVVSLQSNGIVIDGTQTQAISGLLGPSAASGALLSLGSSTLTASEVVITGSDGKPTTEAVIDGHTLIAGGSPIPVNGHTMSLGASGIVVDNTLTAALSGFDPAATGAVFTLGSTSLTALEIVVTGIDGKPTTEVIVDRSTLTENGTPATIAGHTLTFGPSGIAVDGTRTEPLSLITPPPSLQPEEMFVENGPTYTATPVFGWPGVYVVDGRTVSVGGQAVTVDGLMLSAQSDGLVVDGTDTISFHSGTGITVATVPSVGPQNPPSSTTTTSGNGRTELVPWLWWSVLGLLVYLW
ncbi:hypothetical protein LTR56_017970 [Elasticomyces elasticus]|nr:hypothetical protein LTR56_017970 [Elasticomyces elasticus]KAK3637171.1 hypothetical protein LTR22_018361 [Elasticomyces elasticus]KAK4914244.1 hypothetical protein LTR49_017487 [Elasticomyces elasticus]KAK5749664.1 hypothetical protein LTS12_020302 [Elasticomyces elasticus]